jgi:MYXO-CTERM domain-containing protein
MPQLGSLCHRRVALAWASVLLAACAGPPDADTASSAPAVALRPPAAVTAPSTGTTRTTVTLITGDRVHLIEQAGRPPVEMIEPAPGRGAMQFAKARGLYGRQGHLYVVPMDAQPLLAAKRLDPRLFDVTGLIEQGLDDAHRAELPLIATYAQPGAHVRALAPSGTRTKRALASVNGAALVAKKSDAPTFWRTVTAGASKASLAPASGLAQVWLDGVARPLLDRSAPQVGAPAAWARGVTGRGVTVAVLDTGALSTHLDLVGRIGEARDFTESGSAEDVVGHGTHVAGTIAGTGAASSGLYQGIAPEATLLIGRVCLERGCPESAIIAGMEWAAPRARIVNMSLGGPPTDGSDPMSQAVDRLTAQHGALFVIAAGNAGEASGGVGTPSTAPSALTVASVTKEDEMSEFSSRGPRTDAVVKPDIAAPGSDIVAARAPGTPDADTDPVDDHYTRLSGTSMASPHVAGAAALLAQQHPTWRAAELKAALMSMSHPIANATVYDQGVGRLDLARATSQVVFATTPSVSFGLFPYPHDQAAMTKSVTYRNDGAAAVTLDLALAAVRDGEPVLTNPFALGAQRVTVPAGGTADVAVMFDPDRAEIGLYSARITATAGDVRVVVGLGAYPEPESYDLTISAATRAEDDAMTVLVVNTGNQEYRHLELFEERTTLRLRRGRYDVLAVAAAADYSYQTVLVSPGVALDRHTEVMLDARGGEPVSIDVGRPTVPQYLAAQIGSGKEFLSRASLDLTGSPTVYAVPSDPVDDDRLVFGVWAGLGSPAGVEPYRYSLAFSTRDRVPSPRYQVRDPDLAVQRAQYYTQGANDFDAYRVDAARDGDLGSLFEAVEQPLPGRMTEYYTARPGVEWMQWLGYSTRRDDPRGALDELTVAPIRGYAAGTMTDVRWYRPPVGPAFGTLPLEAWRMGDLIALGAGLFSPSQPGHATDSTGLVGGGLSNGAGITGTTTLSRDGTVLETFEIPGFMQAEVPPEAATYTLETTATRTSPFSNLGTRAEATWTFRTAHVEGERSLPLLFVRASGTVDDNGVAPAGTSYALSLLVERPFGAPDTAVTELGLEVSYDDGATWQTAPVERTGATGTATLSHPAGDGFVSLRLSARDADGNAVRHTTVRSYAIGGAVAAPDAGVPSPDAGADPDSGSPLPDAGGAGGDDGDAGCGCRAGSGAPGAIVGLLLIAIAAGRRRRR